MSSFVDRYRALGLSRNPFTAPLPDAAASLTFLDRGVPKPPPEGSGAFFQVIGPAGFGKSTHLDHWRADTPGPRHYIPRKPYRSRWTAAPEPTPGGTMYGDEIDRMPAVRRASWFRACADAGVTLVIGTHVDLSKVARRCGYDDLQTHWLNALDEAEFDRFVQVKLDAVSDAARTPTPFSRDELDRALTQSRGIPREADMVLHKLLASHALESPSVTR